MTKRRRGNPLLLWGACLFTLPLHATPARHGNEFTPTEGDHWLQARWGFFGHYVFDGYFSVLENNAKIHDSRFMTNAGELTLNLFERWDLQAGLGAIKIDFFSNLSPFYASGTFRNSALALDFSSALYWNAGINGSLFKFGPAGFGVGYFYEAAHPKLNAVRDEFRGVTHYQDIRGDYYGWEIMGGVDVDIPLSQTFTFRPVGSFNFTYGRLDLPEHNVQLEGNTTITLQDMWSGYTWGYAIGASLSGGPLSITGQAGFISELSAFFGFQLNF